MAFKTFKNVLLSSVAAMALSTSVNADVIWSEDFETDGNSVRYETSVPEFSDGAGDFFKRIDSNNTGVGSYYEVTGQNGNFYFAGMDLDGEGASLPLTITFAPIDITGATDLVFKGLFAEDDDGTNQDWDDTDNVLIEYSIDGGAFQPLMQFAEFDDGDTYNQEPGEDTDFDGEADGAALTSTFAEFSKAIAATGSTLTIRITLALNSGDEDFAFDSLRVEGTVAAPTKEDAMSGDFDGNGYTDVLWKKSDSSYEITLMDASGKAGRIQVMGNRGWTAEATGNFDGDLTTDILFKKTDGSLVIWYMNASGKAGQHYVMGDKGWSVKGTGDFNADGNSDILFKKVDGSLVAWNMDASGKIGQQYIGSENNRTVETIADFDGNGYDDVLVKIDNGSRVVWYMGATGKESSLVAMNAALTNWNVVGTGDFDANGDADLLLQKENGSYVISLLNKSFITIDVTNNTNYIATSTGDFNGDMTTDILWERANGYVIWYMDAGVKTGSLFLSK